MCRPHWYRVPQSIRNRVWHHYTPGQSWETATTEYLLAAAEAVEHVAREERQRIENSFRAVLEGRRQGAGGVR
jgi:hypothetical protein